MSGGGDRTVDRETCQALVPISETEHRVCRQDRYASWEVSCAGVRAIVDLCRAHGELVMRERGALPQGATPAAGLYTDAPITSDFLPECARDCTSQLGGAKSGLAMGLASGLRDPAPALVSAEEIGR